MPTKYLAAILPAVIAVAALSPMRPFARGDRAEASRRPSVAIASVSVNPSEIRTAGRPSAATVTVKVAWCGEMPAGATATVEAQTAQSDPTGNNVSYSGAVTTRLRRSPAVFRFTIRPERQTVSGSVTVSAILTRTTGGVSMEETRRYGQVRLRTIAP